VWLLGRNTRPVQGLHAPTAVAKKQAPALRTDPIGMLPTLFARSRVGEIVIRKDRLWVLIHSGSSAVCGSKPTAEILRVRERRGKRDVLGGGGGDKV